MDNLPLPFNALSYLMVARYAVQATVVNELLGLNDKTAPTLWSLLSQHFLQFQSQTKGDLYVKMHPKKTTRSKRHAPLHISLENLWSTLRPGLPAPPRMSAYHRHGKYRKSF